MGWRSYARAYPYSHWGKYALSSSLSIYSTLIEIVSRDYNAAFLCHFDFYLFYDGAKFGWNKSQWLWRRSLKVVTLFLLFPKYLSWGKHVALHLNKLESPLPNNALCQFGWHWPIASRDVDENVKCLQTDRQTDGRTGGQQRSEKLTWALSSGELRNLTSLWGKSSVCKCTYVLSIHRMFFKLDNLHMSHRVDNHFNFRIRIDVFEIVKIPATNIIHTPKVLFSLYQKSGKDFTGNISYGIIFPLYKCSVFHKKVVFCTSAKIIFSNPFVDILFAYFTCKDCSCVYFIYT